MMMMMYQMKHFIVRTTVSISTIKIMGAACCFRRLHVFWRKEFLNHQGAHLYLTKERRKRSKSNKLMI